MGVNLAKVIFKPFWFIFNFVFKIGGTKTYVFRLNRWKKGSGQIYQNNFLNIRIIYWIYVSYLGPDRVLNILPLLQDLLDVILEKKDYAL